MSAGEGGQLPAYLGLVTQLFTQVFSSRLGLPSTVVEFRRKQAEVRVRWEWEDGTISVGAAPGLGTASLPHVHRTCMDSEGRGAASVCRGSLGEWEVLP